MRLNRLLPGALLLLATLPLGACDDSPTDTTPPDEVPEAQLTFLRFATAAPALTTTQVSFWAVRGDDREAEIRFLPSVLRAGTAAARDGYDEDGEDGERFLRFRVSGSSLLRYPDGRGFQTGDSVLITIRVVDATRFLFEFSPAGLAFDPARPAELEVSYEYCDRDYDDDGREGDDDDRRIAQQFGFWRQERLGQPWARIGTLKVEDLREVEAKINGFTRYAVASN